MVGSIGTGVAGQVLLVVSGVVSARALGPENRGLLALVLVVSAIATQIGSLGVPLSVTYWIASRGVSARRLLRSLRGFRAAQLGVVLAIQAVMLIAVLEPSIPPDFLWIGFLTLAVTASGLSQMYGLAVLQGLQRFTAFNVLRTLNGALYTLGVLTLWATHRADLTSIALAYIGASIVAAIVIGLIVLRGAPVAGVGDEITPRPLISFGLRSLVGSAPPVETFRLDQLLVGLALTPIALGYYVVALAFTNLTRFIGQSIGMVTYPHVAATNDRATQLGILRRDVALGSVVCGSVTLVLIVLVPLLVPFFFGSTFSSSITVARILLVAALIASLRRILVDATRGSGRPLWGAIAESLTLLALPCVIAVSHYTDSLSAVAVVIAGANLIGLLAIAPALLGVGYRRSEHLGSSDVPGARSAPCSRFGGGRAIAFARRASSREAP